MSVVEVVTGARLHFGLICGRKSSRNRFGGIGLMLRRPCWRISVSPSNDPSCTVPTAEVRDRVEGILPGLCHDTGLNGLRVAVHDEIPLHRGLGAGTQITLALATAAQIAAGRPRPANSMRLASRLDRVRRSAVGAFGFDRGGFIVDHGQNTRQTERSLRNYQFPDLWRVVLLLPAGEAGLSGAKEESVFHEERHMAQSVVQSQTCLIRDVIVPAVQDHEFDVFRDALREYGRNAGSFFKSQQGGVFSSPVIQQLSEVPDFKDLWPVQSSWGPTAAVFTESRQHADDVVVRIRRTSFAQSLRCLIAEPLNCGASVKTVAPECSDYVARG